MTFVFYCFCVLSWLLQSACFGAHVKKEIKNCLPTYSSISTADILSTTYLPQCGYIVINAQKNVQHVIITPLCPCVLVAVYNHKNKNIFVAHVYFLSNISDAVKKIKSEWPGCDSRDIYARVYSCKMSELDYDYYKVPIVGETQEEWMNFIGITLARGLEIKKHALEIIIYTGVDRDDHRDRSVVINGSVDNKRLPNIYSCDPTQWFDLPQGAAFDQDCILQWMNSGIIKNPHIETDAFHKTPFMRMERGNVRDIRNIMKHGITFNWLHAGILILSSSLLYFIVASCG